MSLTVQFSEIGIIILAAGESARMRASGASTTKQLLPFGDSTLLESVLQTAMTLEAAEVMVVSGAYAQDIEQLIDKHPVGLVHNPDWRSGMGSSIKAGVRSVLRLNADIQGVMLLLADQPLLTKPDLQRLLFAVNQADIWASAAYYPAAYGLPESLGVPAFFRRAMIVEQLLNIDDKSGAKSLLLALADKVQKVCLPNASYDIDTLQDYLAVSSKA